MCFESNIFSTVTTNKFYEHNKLGGLAICCYRCRRMKFKCLLRSHTVSLQSNSFKKSRTTLFKKCRLASVGCVMNATHGGRVYRGTSL